MKQRDQNRTRCIWLCISACAVSCSLSMSQPSYAREARPSLFAACLAWDNHIADLIDQHRRSSEVDDAQLGEIIRLFYEAKSACSALRFEEGMAIYETIPIGAVRNRKLR